MSLNAKNCKQELSDYVESLKYIQVLFNYFKVGKLKPGRLWLWMKWISGLWSNGISKPKDYKIKVLQQQLLP